MRGRGIFFNVLGASAILVGAVGAGAYLRERRAEQASPSDKPASASGASAPKPSVAPTNCDVLARITPVVPPPLAVADLGDGTKKLTSVEAGYSLVVPASWFVTGDLFGTGFSAFGQAHMSSYDPKTVDVRMQTTHGMVAPEAGIHLDFELWMNPDRETADQYVRRVQIGPDQNAVLPGTLVTIAGKQAYHAAIQEEHRYQPDNAPLIITRQTRLLWLIPSPNADRMLVVHATPGESSLRATVEEAISKLTLFPPARPQLPVIHQRDEILARWLVDKTGAPIAGRRAEATLMSYAEANAAMSSGGLLRIDRDPEELFWLVAVSGPDLPQGRGALRAGPLPPTAWIMYETPAASDQFEMTSSMLSSNGTWPSGFDALPDRCR